MPRIFNRATDAKPTDWREDAKFVKASTRLAAVERLMAEARERVRQEHAARLRGLAAEVERAELEVLAGRGSEATLAAKQQAHLDARMLEAKDKLAIEDLTEEQATLEGKVPALRRAAKRVALKSIRAKYRAVLLRLQGLLTDAVQADAELFALLADGRAQFVGTSEHPGDDEDGFPVAAKMQPVSRSYLNLTTGGHAFTRTVEGNTAAFLDIIEGALKALDADEAAEAAPGASPESAGLV